MGFLNTDGGDLFAQYVWTRVLALIILIFAVRFIASPLFDPRFYIGASEREIIVILVICLVFIGILYILVWAYNRPLV